MYEMIIGFRNPKKRTATKKRIQEIRDNFINWWTNIDRNHIDEGIEWSRYIYGAKLASENFTPQQLVMLMKFYLDHQTALESIFWWARRYRQAVDQMNEQDMQAIVDMFEINLVHKS